MHPSHPDPPLTTFWHQEQFMTDFIAMSLPVIMMKDNSASAYLVTLLLQRPLFL